MGVLTLVYSVVAYLIFFAVFLYLIVFVGGDTLAFLGAPKTIDSGPSQFSGAPAALANIGLLLLFGVQHSIMARQSFKKQWAKIVSWPLERSTYVLATVAVLLILYLGWQPMVGVVWSVEAPLWSGVLKVLFFLGFGIVLLSTFLINHFDLFGLQQGWMRFKGKELPKPKFVTPMLYKHVRHPLYLGFLIAFWATPHMTTGHLLFSAVWTAYIFVAIGYEERDMISLFGDQYKEYMAKVPSILPLGGRK